ncbi:MAG: cupin domain-containing protein [Hadesarchaea archaeon]|nr:cupin domain-containing protein [Hadesarchaea archaeon]
MNKPWGREEILYQTEELIVLRVHLKGGEETSLHKHLERDEAFIILSGRGHLELEEKQDSFSKGDTLFISKGNKHRWFAKDDVVMIEVTNPPLDDSIRINDRYGRK